MSLRSDVAGLSDACPSCFPGDAPAAVPAAVRDGADGTLTAAYACPACGTEWRTWWQVATAWPVRRAEGAAVPALDKVISLMADLLDGEELEAV